MGVQPTMIDSTITPPKNTGRWVLLATITASSMAFIDSSALNVALTALQKDLQATGSDLIWIVNAYLLLLASLILLGGSLGDRYGRNRIFRTGIIVFAGASLVCGLAPTVNLLILARAVQGIGGALLVPGSLAILSASFPPEKRGQAIGSWSSFATITTLLAPALGGALAGAGLWRGVFFINLPLAIVAIFALGKVPETKDPNAASQMDYPGTVLIVVGLGGLTVGAIGLGQGNSDGAFNPLPIVSLLVGLIALAGFIVVESRSNHPLVPLGLFKNRTFSGTNLMTVFLYGALSGTLFFLPLNLIQVQGYPPQIAGLTLLPFSLVLSGMSPIMGRLVSRIGPRLPLTIGPLLVGVAFVLVALPGLTNGPADYWVTYFPAILVLSIGMGITVAPLTTAVMGSVPSQQAGVASGVNNALTRSAQGMAVAVFGAIALLSFSSGLSARLDQNQVDPQRHQQLEQNANKLGNTPIPVGVDGPARDAIQLAIRLTFIDMFRLLSVLGAVLSWLSALAALILVKNRLEPAYEPPRNNKSGIE